MESSQRGEEINSFDDALDQGLKPYLVNASGGIRFVYDDWNANHPDKQIEYTLNTEFSYADLFASIRSGDYDWSADLIPVFNLQDKDTVAGLVISDPVAWYRPIRSLISQKPSWEMPSMRLLEH